MADTIIEQKLNNVSAQLAEMQATMMLWMEQQNGRYADQERRHVEQEKKTSNSPTITADLLSASPHWRKGSGRRAASRQANETARRKRPFGN